MSPHSHGTGLERDVRPLALTLGLVLAYLVFEVVGGILANSLALLADAGHMLSDAAALALTLFAMRFARRPAKAQRTFGYYRVEILAALVNGAALVAIAALIVIEAFQRLARPVEVAGPLMLAVAAGGLLVNLAGIYLLRGHASENLNMRGAFLHVLTDALGSVQAIAAGALIWAFGWDWVDLAASVLIAALVVFSSWSLLRQSLAVLMESAPAHISVDDVHAALAGLPRVAGVHDLHVWTITSGFVALSAHLTCAEPGDRDAVLRSAQDVLRTRFGIQHTTLQLECEPSCHGLHC